MHPKYKKFVSEIRSKVPKFTKERTREIAFFCTKIYLQNTSGGKQSAFTEGKQSLFLKQDVTNKVQSNKQTKDITI